MEDFHSAGSIRVVLRELRPTLNLATRCVDGTTLRERLDQPAEYVDRSVIRGSSHPISTLGGLLMLEDNLAPRGALIKRAAATPELFEFKGRAIVFEGLEDLSARIDSMDLDVTERDVLVLRRPSDCL